MSPIDDLELVEPSSRAEWRGWLVEHHATSPGVRLAIGKKGNTVTTLSYDDAVEEALCFGWIDSTARRLDEHRYTVLATPRKPGSVWAQTNKARVERLIASGDMTPVGQAVIDAAKADGSWNSLDDVEALIEPTDLLDALDRAGARENWDSLTATPRKLALYWIAQAKRPETRAKRIAETVTAAEQGRGPR